MAQYSCNIVAIEHITLDGVFQAPARPDEDTRSDFAYGGWANARSDERMQEAMSEYMTGGWSLLSGTRAYEDMHEGWQVRQPESPMTKMLADAAKFVVSRNAEYQPVWENSTLLVGEAAETVADLKQRHTDTLIIFGSAALLRALMNAGLVDDLLLLTHPVILGKGLRLFTEENAYSSFELQHATTTDKGVVISGYRHRGE